MVVQDQTSYDKVGVVIGLSKKAHMVLAVNIQKYMESEPEKRAKYFSTYNSLMETGNLNNYDLQENQGSF